MSSHEISIDDLLGHNIETNSFGMYSDEGSQAVRQLVSTAVTNFNDGADAATIAAIFSGARAEIGKTHTEIYDTDVREQMFDYIEHQIGQRLGNFAARDFTDTIIRHLH